VKARQLSALGGSVATATGLDNQITRAGPPASIRPSAKYMTMFHYFVIDNNSPGSDWFPIAVRAVAA